MPITRTFLASYYDKYPFDPLSDEVSRLSSQIRSFAQDLLQAFPPTQGCFFFFYLFIYFQLLPSAISLSSASILGIGNFDFIFFLLFGGNNEKPKYSRAYCFYLGLQLQKFVRIAKA